MAAIRHCFPACALMCLAAWSASADGPLARPGGAVHKPEAAAVFAPSVVGGGGNPAATGEPSATALNFGEVEDGVRLSFPAGVRVAFAYAADEGLRLRLRERRSGMVWHEGPASEFEGAFWLIRSGETELVAELSHAGGEPAGRREFILAVEAGEHELYPGLLARVIRLGDSMPSRPEAERFRPRQQALGVCGPSRPVYEGYPPYRTAEGVFPPRRVLGERSFEWPDYWHKPLAQPHLVPEPEDRGAWRTFSVALGDLLDQDFLPAAALLEGLLMVEEAGRYEVRAKAGTAIELDLPGYAQRIVRRETAVQEGDEPGRQVYEMEIEAELAPGLVPFQLRLFRGQIQGPGWLRLTWRTPTGEGHAPMDGSRFLHRVPRKAEQAYAAFSEGQPWRHLALPEGDDAGEGGAAALLDGFDPSEHVGSDESYGEMHDTLWRAFSRPGAPAGSVEVAEALLSLVHARFVWLAENPEEVQPRRFMRIRGDWVGHIRRMRGFLEHAQRHPRLQRSALEVRALVNSYLELIHSRPFLTELHFGANDCYRDENNFVFNNWRTAEAWDNPLAFDAARALFDNHFSYRPGDATPHRRRNRRIGEGLHSDGVVSFHNANGRQINMGAYGKDWMNRIIRGYRNPAASERFAGSPWGNTREQNRRLAQYALAYEWIYYRGAAAFTGLGRHNTHSGRYHTRYATPLLALPEPCLAPNTRDALQAMVQRIETEAPLEGNTFLFRHLLMVHRREDYYIDVKMNSPLAGGVETFAGATPGNLSFGDGVHTLLRSGEEYRPIHAYNIPEALWRFRSLPGTTQLNYEWGSLRKYRELDRYRRGGGSRAGGVSDGEFGHAAFEFVSHRRNATAARKFFAFTEDGMMVLAAGVTGGRPAPEGDWSYRSNLNQTAFTAPLTIAPEGGETRVVPADETSLRLALPLDRRYWVKHAGIGYLVLPTGNETGSGPGELAVSISVRNPMNRLAEEIMNQEEMAEYREKARELAEADPPRQATVLEIWIDHGSQPEGGQAAYFVNMRPERRGAAEHLAQKPVAVLANLPEVQAVRDTDSGALHAFFYEPGRISDPARWGEVSVDKPLSLMLREAGGGGLRLAAQDPLAACVRETGEMSDAVQVSFGGRSRSLSLPGAGDPDDRFRGAVKMLKVEN